MGFFTDLAKTLTKKSERNEMDEKTKKAIVWAERIGDKEDGQRLRTSSELTPHEARLSNAKTTPVDALAGLMARRHERRDIRLDAAFEAAKIGELFSLYNITITNVAY